MSTYYLKKCGHQELGSVGADGRPNCGRYLLTSMNEEVLAFFSPLSTAQLNDSALLPIFANCSVIFWRKSVLQFCLSQ